ncbi:MAG: GerAB/ArcD/ProY family transporter [Peptococcia bacterium]|jgi:spore germination protein KB
MQLEQGRISSAQLVMLIIGFNFSTSLILNPGRMAGQDAWLAVLAGLGEGLIFVFIITSLGVRFKGKNLIEINDLVFGSYLGKVVSLAYLWYFSHLASMVLRSYGDFFTDTIYPQTPLIVFIILLVLICASAVRNGIEVIVRCSLILVPITILFLVVDVFLLLKDMKFTNFLPIFNVPWQKFLWASHGAATFPFGEIIAFLMVFAFVQDQQKIRVRTMMGIIIAGLLLSTVVARNIAVLGITEMIQSYPSFIAIRLINIAKVLTRLEIIVVTSFLVMGFLKVAVLYYGTVLGLAQIFKLRSYLPLVFPLGIIMVVLSILPFASSVELINFAYEIYPYYSLPFQVGLPLLSLIVAVIRGLPKKE